MTEVKFLSHIISQGGVAVDLSKVEVMISWERLKNVSKIISFLGLAGYYWRFIYGFSQLSLSLIRLTWKEIPFRWNKECERNFVELKKKLTTSPVLIMDLEKPLKCFVMPQRRGKVESYYKVDKLWRMCPGSWDHIRRTIWLMISS